MEYYSAIKKSKIMLFAATWMKLETLILSEVSQKEKDKYHVRSLISGTNEPTFRKKQLMGLENRLMVAKGEEKEWTGSLGLVDANYCIWSG